MPPSLDDVLITDELTRRPARSPDYEAESRALAALAEVIAESPETILQTLVQTALDSCRADSAGISILEPDGASSVFRWVAIAGQFASHVGGRMPREGSPCGVVLDRDAPLLFAYPERHFDYGPVNPPMVEALLVPFHVERKPVGTLWVIAHTPSRQFDIEDQRLLTSLSRFASAYQMKTALLATDAGLRASAEEMRQILDTCATGITRCSRELRYLSVNSAYARLAGLPAEQIIGRPIVDVMGIEAFEVIRPYVERVLRGERVEYEAEVPFAAGEIRFIHVVYTPWIEVGGQVGGWVGSVSDITDLKRTAVGLQEREQRLRLALDASGAGSWMWDARTNRADWDGRFRELYGFVPGEPSSPDAWPGRIHEEDRPRILKSLEEVLVTRTRDSWDNTFRVVRPDGSVAWIESLGQAELDAEGQIVRLTGLDLDVTDRRRAEEALRENQERDAFLFRLSDALRPLSDALIIQEVAARLLGEFLNVNRVNYADIEGADFIVRLSYVNGVSPFVGRGPVSTFGEAMLESRRRGEPVAVNDVRTDPRLTESERTALLAKDVAAFASAMLVKNNQWVAVLGAHNATPRVWTRSDVELIRDVAQRLWEAVERARTEEALREREQRLKLALDASMTGVWSWDPLTNRSTWDDRFNVHYGFAPDTPQTLDTWISSVHAEDRPRVLAHLEDIVRGPQNDWDIMFRAVRPDGTVVWMHGLGRADRGFDGRIIRMSGINLDITERRRAEEALQALHDEERDRTLRLLLETAPQGIVSVNAQGVIVTANRALETMFGWVQGELIGQPVERLVPPALQQGHVSKPLEFFASPQARVLSGMDLVGQRKDGSTFPVELSLNHVATADGGHAIAFVTDISARKQGEEALQRSHDELERRTLQLSRLASQLTLAEQNARKQLASTLHDGLQQLLFSVGINLDQAVMANSRGDQVRLIQKARADIKEAVEAARTLSVNLFPPVLHVGGLPAALSWLARRTREQYGVAVSVTADPKANPEASDVRILLFEGVRELLFNAVKHAHTDRVDVNLAFGPGDTIQIQVSDEGVGFDPTVTVHRKDQHKVGLGLFSIQERIAFLGGRLDIQSAPGKGARFSLTVPRQASDGVEARRQDTGWKERLVFDSTSGKSKSLRILIADDHAVARAGMREFFSKLPALQIVGEAANGIEAISKAVALNPDVIVMDVSLPLMNGVEATREIHGTLPHVQIVGLSTHDDEVTERSMREAGARAYFTKNEGTDQLLDYLLSLLVQSKGASQNS